MAYTKQQKQDILDTICERISEGESLRSIMKSEDLPNYTTFFAWLNENEEYSNQYARACAVRADVIFEQILDIADDQEEDIIKNFEGEEIVNNNVINRSKVRIDARKWVLGKMNPKKYGDRVINENENKNFNIEMTREEREKEIAEIMKKAKNK